MTSMSELRAAIAAALTAIPGVAVYRVWPNKIEPPAILVEEISGTYAQTYRGGILVQPGLLLLVAGTSSAGASMDALDLYLEPDSPEVGQYSIDHALRAATPRAFGLASFENPGSYNVNGGAYYGVHLTLGEEFA